MALEVGSIVEGKITGVKKFGAFVALPGGKSGMVHISEVSNSFIEDLDSVLTDGQEVKVKIINIADDGKIALSIKRTLPKPEPGAQRAHAGGNARSAGNRPANRSSRPARSEAPRVWQPKVQAAPQGNMSFEDMMSRFKSQSEEKIADLKRVTENRRGGGYSRKR